MEWASKHDVDKYAVYSLPGLAWSLLSAGKGRSNTPGNILTPNLKYSAYVYIYIYIRMPSKENIFASTLGLQLHLL